MVLAYALRRAASFTPAMVGILADVSTVLAPMKGYSLLSCRLLRDCGSYEPEEYETP